MKRIWIVSLAAISIAPALLLAQGKGKVVEEIIARVNNEIITLSDYKKAEATVKEEVAQDCQNCPQDRLAALLKDHAKNLLRDLIDQSLLSQRAKDDDINVESEVVKRLDEVRQQNTLGSLEELEKAVESQGISWEDYKSSIRNQLLTQAVVHREVGSRITIGHEEVKKYYDVHQNDFVRPENVLLAEITLNTEKKTPDEVAASKKKADDLRDRLKKGDDFTELAKRYSEGPTAKQGGELGSFERGQLSKQIEDVVFKMNRGDITDVIQTKTGFEILKVAEHYQAGLQPIEKVENEIMNRLYMDRMQPVLRDFLAELREQSYVIVKPGYVDSAAVAGGSVIQETAPTPDAKDKKLSKKAKRAT